MRYSTNRPSLGSWNGWPWDSHNIAEKTALLRNIKGKNVIAGVECGKGPEDVQGFPLELLAQSHQVFSKDGGFDNVAQIATRALRSCQK